MAWGVCSFPSGKHQPPDPRPGSDNGWFGLMRQMAAPTNLPSPRQRPAQDRADGCDVFDPLSACEADNGVSRPAEKASGAGRILTRGNRMTTTGERYTGRHRTVALNRQTSRTSVSEAPDSLRTARRSEFNPSALRSATGQDPTTRGKGSRRFARHRGAMSDPRITIGYRVRVPATRRTLEP
jgi:hypothetical protein